MTELQPSEALVEAARADQERLREVWSGLQSQRAELVAELDRVDADISDVVAQLRRLGELLGDQMELPVEDEQEDLAPEAGDEQVLAGADIRKRAVDVLLQSGRAAELLHYKCWFELVVDAGYTIRGRDPQAVFLTQISRSPLVVRGPDNGTYRLDRAAPQRLATRLEQLRAQRNELVHGDHDRESWDLDALTTTLHDLTLEASRTERQLAEAANTIHDLDAEEWFSGREDKGFEGSAIGIEVEPIASERHSGATPAAA